MANQLTLDIHCCRCGDSYLANSWSATSTVWAALLERERALQRGESPCRIGDEMRYDPGLEFCPRCANTSMALTFWPGLVAYALEYVEAASRLDPNYRISAWNVKYDNLDVRPGCYGSAMEEYERALEWVFDNLCHGCGCEKSFCRRRHPFCLGWQSRPDYSREFVYRDDGRNNYFSSKKSSLHPFHSLGYSFTFASCLEHQVQITGPTGFRMTVHRGKRATSYSFTSACCGDVFVQVDQKEECAKCGKLAPESVAVTSSPTDDIIRHLKDHVDPMEAIVIGRELTDRLGSSPLQ